MLRTLPFLTLFWLLAACSPAVMPPNTPIIAPNETQSAQQATQSAEPSATPTVTPTPTPIPADVLGQANAAFSTGRHEDALPLYRQVLTLSAEADIRAAAALGAGQAALQAGAFEEAQTTLSVIVNELSADPRWSTALFLRGDAALGLGQWNAAIADYTAYLAARPGLIDSYVYERIGDANLGLGDFTAALSAYNAALNDASSTAAQFHLREKLAQLWRSAGDIPQAIAQYDAILAAAQNRPYRASISYAAADALLSAGDIASGLRRMQTVFEEFADRPEAYLAMQALLENGVSLDRFQQAQVRFNYGDFGAAIDDFNAYTTQRPLVDVPPLLYLQLGRAYREVGSTAASLTAFQSVIDLFPTQPAFGQALLERGRTYFLSGDIAAAIDAYLNLVNQFGYLPEAPEALWRAAYLYASSGQAAEAVSAFARLAADYPDSSQAGIGLLLAAVSALQAGSTGGAEQYFAGAAAITQGDLRLDAYLNVGWLGWQRGDTSLAAQAFALAAEGGAESYFGLRIADIQAGRAPFEAPVSLRFEVDDVTDQTVAEAWLRATFGFAEDADLRTRLPALQNDPWRIRGETLWQIGAYEDASAEFDILLAATQSDPLASYQLALYFRDLGVYHASLQAASHVIRAAGIGTLDAPPFIARLRYPIYFLADVQAQAVQHQLDPLLLFALIRQESLFNPRATAAAGEIGLTQIIPATGQYLAEALDWPDYQPSLLFRPHISIAFGAAYLAEQLNAFSGSAPAALSAYNAGPGRAAQWQAIAAGRPDLFISSITVDTTRTYVQRIYAHYAIYRALYGDA